MRGCKGREEMRKMHIPGGPIMSLGGGISVSRSTYGLAEREGAETVPQYGKGFSRRFYLEPLNCRTKTTPRRGKVQVNLSLLKM